jgi:predicted ArsR family transcriptional regulator
MMLQHGPLSVSQVARDLGVGKSQAQRLLRRMKKGWLVELSGRARKAVWHLPGRGPSDAPKSGKVRAAARPRSAESDPVVAALLEVREKAARELDRIDRMLAIAREEG